ncbi:MAG TPA: hypothetical protein P5164_08885 [Thermoanaerobaculia bacterium]|nr:hypothetical protein [Thermoanaerobaculia bacterium]
MKRLLLLTTLLGAFVFAPVAEAAVKEGCNECRLGKCRAVAFGSFGMDVCIEGTEEDVTWPPGVTKTCDVETGQVCKRESTEVTVTGDDPCPFWCWIFGDCSRGDEDPLSSISAEHRNPANADGDECPY